MRFSLKRIHLFEFEDFRWFPRPIRDLMTDYLITFHRMVGSAEHISALLRRIIAQTGQTRIVDLCSGSGGPMESVLSELKRDHPDLALTLTDLYPNRSAIARLSGSPDITYWQTPVDAAKVPRELDGIRTMVGSFHHMPVSVARAILQGAYREKNPIMIFEVSDNSFPLFLCFLAFPLIALSQFLLILTVRPFKWQHFVFTYLVPILPLLIGWDGFVSNVRTYCVKDLEALTADLSDGSYAWEIGTVKPKRGPGNMLYCLGMPK